MIGDCYRNIAIYLLLVLNFQDLVAINLFIKFIEKIVTLQRFFMAVINSLSVVKAVKSILGYLPIRIMFSKSWDVMGGQLVTRSAYGLVRNTRKRFKNNS